MSRMDVYERLPEGMKEYLSNYGWHFSKKMCEFAVSNMRDRNGAKISTYTKEKLDALLKQFNIELKKTKGMMLCMSAIWLLRITSGPQFPTSSILLCLSGITLMMKMHRKENIQPVLCRYDR